MSHPFSQEVMRELKQRLKDQETKEQSVISINGVPHKMAKLVKEVEVFMDILQMIPQSGLDDAQKKVILEELKLSL